MNVFVIAFRLENLNRRAPLIERIKQYGKWMSYFEGMIVVATRYDAAAIQADLLQRIGPTDSLLVIAADPRDVSGLLPGAGWQWLAAVGRELL